MIHLITYEIFVSHLSKTRVSDPHSFSQSGADQKPWTWGRCLSLGIKNLNSNYYMNIPHLFALTKHSMLVGVLISGSQENKAIILDFYSPFIDYCNYTCNY